MLVSCLGLSCLVEIIFEGQNTKKKKKREERRKRRKEEKKR